MTDVKRLDMTATATIEELDLAWAVYFPNHPPLTRGQWATWILRYTEPIVREALLKIGRKAETNPNLVVTNPIGFTQVAMHRLKITKAERVAQRAAFKKSLDAEFGAKPDTDANVTENLNN